MDRHNLDDGAKRELIYKEALEFIGEVRGGISWEHLCIGAVRYSDALLDMAHDKEDVREFLSSRGIERKYVHENVKKIFYELHFNREDNHYLTLILPGTATESRIHRRWKDLMLIYHPDRNGDNYAYALECTKMINEAYGVLKDPEKKAAYDREIDRRREFHRRMPDGGPVASQRTRRFALPPGARRALPALFTASYITVAAVVLLILFIENRQSKTSERPGGQGAKREGVQNLSEEVNSFVGRYASACEKGDLEGFMSLFSRGAIENKELNYDAIRNDFRRNCGQGGSAFVMKRLDFQEEGEKVVVTGAYEALGKGKTSLTGEMNWVLGRDNGILRIVSLHYD